MAFWSLRRGTSSQSVQGTAAVELEPALEPIQVFLTDRIISGLIAPEGERVTDLLAVRKGIRVQVDEGRWEHIDVGDIVLVAPPPHASQRRIHRSRRRVELTLPPYTVTGTAHMPPGTQLDPFVLRTGRPVIPVTGAWVRVEGDASTDQHLDVAILSVHAIDHARELLSAM